MVNVSNTHQFMKGKVTQETAGSQSKLIELYNQYCAVLVLSDHDGLHELLMNKVNVNRRGRRSREG